IHSTSSFQFFPSFERNNIFFPPPSPFVRLEGNEKGCYKGCSENKGHAVPANHLGIYIGREHHPSLYYEFTTSYGK
ncbi:MAG: hypothetical protein ACRDF4_08255, partial [Rhabdochlamydiaceae bacterium]